MLAVEGVVHLAVLGESVESMDLGVRFVYIAVVARIRISWKIQSITVFVYLLPDKQLWNYRIFTL